ncbi:M48 family metalloprotease [uncultured Brevundimonas sp.]|uniref:PDZ domain-containing protein n=1 Tax=uncultured Brevundimonas sp. TaxID=213418 RepID=UPI0030EEFC7F|tara:strand:- start:27569 stop:28579 length:1011 start_codon:yes stop_codon:yes gene_type:complete
MTNLNGAAAGAMVIALGLAAAACSTPAPGGATALSGSQEPAARLEALVSLDRRVAAVGYRLTTANIELCASRRDVAGWTLHAANQYSDALRPVAEARFGLDGDRPGILAVADDSPAARAGLAAGDLLIRVNGQNLERGDGSGPPSHDGLAANVVRLDLALAEGPVTLDVRRGDTTRTVTLQPTQACSSFFQVDPSDEYNARADGKGVFISSTMAAYAADDDDLAMILGHELAHNVLQHRPPPEPLGDPDEIPATALPRGNHWTQERDADRVGLYLLARAGFDTDRAPGFLRRFGADNWRVRYAQIGHASAEARARALEEANAEIAAKRAAGQPLRP